MWRDLYRVCAKELVIVDTGDCDDCYRRSTTEKKRGRKGGKEKKNADFRFPRSSNSLL